MPTITPISAAEDILGLLSAKDDADGSRVALGWDGRVLFVAFPPGKVLIVLLPAASRKSRRLLEFP